MAHTPGPWTVTLDEVRDARGYVVADAGMGDYDAAEANARLIAAAPEMYAALWHFCHVCEHGDHTDGLAAFSDAYNAARAAIAKAEKGA